jgi:hypothetical protein
MPFREERRAELRLASKTRPWDAKRLRARTPAVRGVCLDCFGAFSSLVLLRLVLRTQPRSVGGGTWSMDFWKRGLAELPPSVAGLLRRTGAPPSDETKSIVDDERSTLIHLDQESG